MTAGLEEDILDCEMDTDLETRDDDSIGLEIRRGVRRRANI